jgi:serine/threonine protein kinase
VAHGDIKPDNFIVTKQGGLVLIDYGAAQAQGLLELSPTAGPSMPLGDVSYIAPEYLKTGLASHSADIFAIGVILYEILTGDLPYKVGHSMHLVKLRDHAWNFCPLIRHRQDMPMWLEPTLQKACHPDKRFRYQSSSELVVDFSTPKADVENARYGATA